LRTLVGYSASNSASITTMVHFGGPGKWPFSVEVGMRQRAAELFPDVLLDDLRCCRVENGLTLDDWLVPNGNRVSGRF